jgi:hypothetical protein
LAGSTPCFVVPRSYRTQSNSLSRAEHMQAPDVFVLRDKVEMKTRDEMIDVTSEYSAP